MKENTPSLNVLRRINSLELRNLINEMYTKDKMQTYEIAAIFKTNSRSINRIMRNLKIPTRKPSLNNDLIFRDKKKFQITPEIKQLLIGGILGDGCLSKNYHHKHYVYSEYHALPQKEYVIWKSKIFGVKFRKRIYWEKRIKGIDKNYMGRMGIFEHYGFTLKSHPYLDYLHQKLYKNKKVIDKEMVEQLNPLGLSVWYMDDGSCIHYPNGKLKILIHHKFNNIEEEKIIINFFKEKFNLECKIYHRKTCDSITFDIANSQLFLNLIKPYIEKIKCMHYKIGISNVPKEDTLKIYDSGAEYFENLDYFNGNYNSYSTFHTFKNRLDYLKNNAFKLSKENIVDELKYMFSLLGEIDL